MAEYTTKDAVIRLFEKWSDGYAYIEIPVQDAIRQVSAIPPADVRPVVRGEWENMNDDLDFHFRCSRCGEETWQTVMGKPRFKYCPMCGAYMRGGDAE